METSKLKGGVCESTSIEGFTSVQEKISVHYLQLFIQLFIQCDVMSVWRAELGSHLVLW